MSRLFDLQHAALGGLWMGLYVALGNLPAGGAAAARAGALQACVSFLVIGANTAFSQRLLRERGAAWAVVGPTLTTTAIAFLFHSWLGTPELLTTLAIVAACAAFGFGFLSLLQQRLGSIRPTDLGRRLWAQRRSA